MKRISAVLIALLVICMLALPVFAAQSATMTVSVSKSNARQGETFTVTVNTTKVENCTSGGFMFQFDKDAFEYVDGSALVSGFAMSGISTANGNVAGYFMSITGGATAKGDIFKATFRVKDTASAGSYTISGTPSLTVSEGGNKEPVSAAVVSAKITVGGTTTAPSEEKTETVPATTAPVEVPTTEATEATEAATTGATEAVDATETLPVKDTQDPTTQPTEIITIGAVTPNEDKAGFPWWIPFALLGIGSIIAIIVIKKKS